MLDVGVFAIWGGGETAAPDDVCHDGEYATTASSVSIYQQLPFPQFLQRPPRQYMLPELQHLQLAFPQPNAPATPLLPSALAFSLCTRTSDNRCITSFLWKDQRLRTSSDRPIDALTSLRVNRQLENSAKRWNIRTKMFVFFL